MSTQTTVLPYPSTPTADIPRLSLPFRSPPHPVASPSPFPDSPFSLFFRLSLSLHSVPSVPPWWFCWRPLRRHPSRRASSRTSSRNRSPMGFFSAFHAARSRSAVAITSPLGKTSSTTVRRSRVRAGALPEDDTATMNGRRWTTAPEYAEALGGSSTATTNTPAPPPPRRPPAVPGDHR